MTILSNKFQLGTYIGVPDDSNASAEAAVTQQYNSFVSAIGQTPSLMNTYVDDSLAESQWVSDAQWEAGSWTAASWSHALTPVVGLPMTSQGENADQSFRNIINSSEDSVFQGIFQAWASAGYSQFYIRPGYEMNGTWMPWSVTSANVGDFVSAFQHIAGLAHAFSGASIQVVWNPNIGPMPVPLGQLYPGNTAVDIVGLDIYGAPVDTGASPANTSTDPTTLTLLDVLALAKADRKPFALPETGGTDASFSTQLANTIAQSGVPVAFMNIWDINDQSGALSWSNSSDNAAATAAAWKQAVQTIQNASQSAPTLAPTPTPAAKPSANDTVVKAGFLAAITDAAGNIWTITSGGQVAINGTVDVYTDSVIELAYVNDTIWQENSSKLWWGETQPNDSWAPSAGAVTNPLPTTPAPTPTPAAKPSANDTVVKAGSVAAIADAGGNIWTITSGGQVAINGTVDVYTDSVIELAYVNGTIWQENGSKLWWGETQSDDSWAPTPGTATNPLPATPTPAPTTSANGTVIKAGSVAGITDASGNKWTITSGGQVAINSTVDIYTSSVIELAYVNGIIWQENSSKLWWGETKPNDAWAPSAGTATSPLPSKITIASTQTTATVSLDQVSVVATSGNHMVFITGTGDTVNLSGGAETITDTGLNNTYTIPVADQGSETFTSDIFKINDTLSFTVALAKTNWNGTPGTLNSYIHVASSGNAAVISLSAVANGPSVGVATIQQGSSETLTSLLAHSII